MKSARVNFGARPNRASTAAKPDIEGRCASSVYPSGFALAANCAPTAPAAPDLVSTTTGCFSSGSSAAAKGRPTTSTAPPGGNGLTSVTGREGYSCAKDGVASAAAAAAPPRKLRLSIRSCLFCYWRDAIGGE